MTKWTHTIQWPNAEWAKAYVVGKTHEGDEVLVTVKDGIQLAYFRSNLERGGVTIRERHPLEGVEPGTLVMVWDDDECPTRSTMHRFVEVNNEGKIVAQPFTKLWDHALTVEQYAEKYL